MYQAICRRSGQHDGLFYYCVLTTGIYCVPSCSSKKPLLKNVQFHATTAEAQAAGYRACKRCSPDQVGASGKNAPTIARICRLLESGQQSPTLEQLAEKVGHSPSHTHRIFREATGITPQNYAEAVRRARLQSTLGTSPSVVRAAVAAGYGSTASLYRKAEGDLGMSPQAYRKQGAKEVIHFAIAACSLGPILVASTHRGVCAILFGEEPEALVNDLQHRFSQAELMGASQDYNDVVAAVVALVERPKLPFNLPLDVQGTAFQQKVWTELRRVQAGETVSYAELAARIGRPSSFRAVAGACARNPLALVIPCHRVVKKDGGLSGYRWGVENKRKLLEREREPQK